jgi:hypothetical protein
MEDSDGCLCVESLAPYAGAARAQKVFNVLPKEEQGRGAGTGPQRPPANSCQVLGLDPLGLENDLKIELIRV